MLHDKDYQGTIGCNIRHLRTSHKYTINEFADILDISSQFLRQIEKGQKGLSISNIIKLINIFSIKFEDLLTDNMAPKQTRLSEKLQALNTQLTESEKEILAELLKVYISHH